MSDRGDSEGSAERRRVEVTHALERTLAGEAGGPAELFALLHEELRRLGTMQRGEWIVLSVFAATTAFAVSVTGCRSTQGAAPSVGVSDKAAPTFPDGPVTYEFNPLDERPVSSAAHRGGLRAADDRAERPNGRIRVLRRVANSAT